VLVVGLLLDDTVVVPVVLLSHRTEAGHGSVALAG
jgi:hypothetical protein